MRIGTLNVVTIVPLFLILAIVLGGLLYIIEGQERLWGQQQEAISNAIVVGEFAHERAILANRDVDTPDNDPGFKAALDRILGDGRVLAVFEMNPSTKQVLWAYPQKTQAIMPNNPPADLATQMNADGTSVSGLEKAGKKITMDGYSAVRLPDRTQLALGVITDASAYVAETHKSVTDVLIASIWVLVAGLIITILVSWVISREVRSLSQTAALISAGNLDVQAKPGIITEIGDLGNTFNTMSDVLKDVLSRTRRSLIEGEQFRTHAELAQSYAGMFRPPVSEDFGACRIAVASTGQDFGLFWSAYGDESSCCAFLGHVRAEDDIATVITASAATRYLQHRLSPDEAQEAIREMCELFKPDYFECLVFRGGNVDHWSIAPDSAPVRETFSGDTRRVWVLQKFSPDSASLIDRYVSIFGHNEPDELARDVIGSLPPGITGAIVLATIVRSTQLSDDAGTKRDTAAL